MKCWKGHGIGKRGLGTQLLLLRPTYTIPARLDCINNSFKEQIFMAFILVYMFEFPNKPNGIQHDQMMLYEPRALQTTYSRKQSTQKKNQCVHEFPVFLQPPLELDVILSLAIELCIVVATVLGTVNCLVLSTLPLAPHPECAAAVAISSTLAVGATVVVLYLRLMIPGLRSCTLSSLRFCTNNIRKDPMHATTIAMLASAELQTNTQGVSICFVTPTVESVARTIAKVMVTRTREKTPPRASDCRRGIRERQRMLKGMVMTGNLY